MRLRRKRTRTAFALALVIALYGCGGSPRPANTVAPAKAVQPVEGAETASVLPGFWAVLGVRGEAGGPSTDNWYRHAASGTCMPREFASFKPRSERVYGPDDVSVSLWSEELQTLITLYTYPARGGIPEEFKEVVGALVKTCGGGTVVSSEVKDPRFPGRANIAACSHAKGAVVAIEQVVLFRREDWAHKARFTYVQPLVAKAYTPSMTLVQAAFNPCPPPGPSA